MNNNGKNSRRSDFDSSSESGVVYIVDKKTEPNASSNIVRTPINQNAANANNYYNSSYAGNGGFQNNTAVGYRPVTTTAVHNYSNFISRKPEVISVFEYDGIEFFGSSKSDLEKLCPFKSEKDLVINCSGSPLHIKPFIERGPKWLSANRSVSPQEITLNWEDFSPPPAYIEIQFWMDLIKDIKENGIERVYCCCLGGIGRTGTMLGSLFVASGYAGDDEAANDVDFSVIDFIRKNFKIKAIETKDQENYLNDLQFEYFELTECQDEI